MSEFTPEESKICNDIMSKKDYYDILGLEKSSD